MKMKNVAWFLLVFCATGWILRVSAQDGKNLSAVPSGSFEFTGTWNCEGTFRNNQVHKSIYTGAVILNGKWLELTEQDTQPATGYLAKYLIGYDPGQKQLIEFDANTFGAATYSSADGWQSGILTMTSAVSQDAKAPSAANRFVYAITGKDSLTIDWQTNHTGKPSWVTADHLACKRAKHE
jgi:hypothetical protein